MLSIKILLPVCFSMVVTKQEVIDCATILSYLHNVPPSYVLSVIDIESKYEVKAYNKGDPYGGAVGLMQILLPTARSMGFDGSRKDLFLPYNNIIYGIKYLKLKLKKYEGNIGNAIAAYNSGKVYVRNGKYINQSHVDKFRLAYDKWRNRVK